MYDDHTQLQIETQALNPDPNCSEHSRRMRSALTTLALSHENQLYAETRGISQSNRAAGWRPGYLNLTTGECELSRFSDGRPAPIHVLEGLPEDWVQSRDAEGRVIAAEPEIVSGFIRGGRFFTRDQAARAAAH